MTVNAMEQLLAFLRHLETYKTHYTLGSFRDAIMVTIRTASRVYEVEFFTDGTIEVETFGPTPGVGAATLSELLAQPEFKA